MKEAMSSLNQSLILVALAIQALLVCSDLTERAEPAREGAHDVEEERSVIVEPPAPPARAPFVACYEQEAR